MTEYHACYALSKLPSPRAARSWRQLVDQLSGTYDRDRQRRRTESTVIHVTAGRTTLCGRDVSRRIDIFEPREAGCRECKRRWELATEPFSSCLCLAGLQYVDGPGELSGAPGAAAELAEDAPVLELSVRTLAG